MRHPQREEFFCRNPFQGVQAAHRGDPMLYDWADAETPFL